MTPILIGALVTAVVLVLVWAFRGSRSVLADSEPNRPSSAPTPDPNSTNHLLLSIITQQAIQATSTEASDGHHTHDHSPGADFTSGDSTVSDSGFDVNS
jgi:hypothetical protein